MNASAASSTEASRGAKQRKCPICGRKAADDAYPFCSERCADVDLHRWLSGSYVVAAADEDGMDSGPEQDN